MTPTTIRVAYTTTRELNDAVTEAASALDMSASEFTRRALVKELARLNGPTPTLERHLRLPGGPKRKRA